MKPKIVILSAFLTPFRSGAEACAEEVPLALAEQYDFIIVTAKLRRNLPKRDRLQDHIPVIRIGFGCAIDKCLFPFLAPLAVRKLKPQIVHAVLESFAGLALIFCRFLVPKSKRILTCQSTNTSFLVRTMHMAANRVTAISSVLIERAKKFGRGDAILIPNGIYLAAIRESLMRSEKVSGRILFVGRLEPMKGVDVLLEAFASVVVPAHLRIVGDGSRRAQFEQLTKDLGITDRVTFVGFVPVPDVYREFAEAEIFCGLSRSEALGNVFLEAQAAGCAVIGTNVGGIPDIVEDGKTGLLVPPDDPDAAHKTLKRLLTDVELRLRLIEAGRASAELYDWTHIAEQYSAVYREIVGG